MFKRFKFKRVWKKVMENDKKIGSLRQEMFLCRLHKCNTRYIEEETELNKLEEENDKLIQKARELL